MSAFSHDVDRNLRYIYFYGVPFACVSEIEDENRFEIVLFAATNLCFEEWEEFHSFIIEAQDSMRH